jgi:MFS family permease
VDLEKIETHDDSGRPARLGSLTQSARSRQLKTARGLLFFVGGWLIFSLIVEWLTIDMQLERVAKEHGVPAARIPELKELVMPTMYAITVGYIILAITYVVFGFLVRKYPVPITITALVIFIGLMLIVAAIGGFQTLWSGIIFKVIIIVGLAKAIQSAIAYQKELDTAKEFAVLPDEEPERPERSDW